MKLYEYVIFGQIACLTATVVAARVIPNVNTLFGCILFKNLVEFRKRLLIFKLNDCDMNSFCD